MNNLSQYIIEKLKLNKNAKAPDGEYNIKDLKAFLSDFLEKFKDVDLTNYQYITHSPVWNTFGVHFGENDMPNISKPIWKKLEKEISKLTYNGDKIFKGEVAIYPSGKMIDFYLDEKVIKIEDLIKKKKSD